MAAPSSSSSSLPSPVRIFTDIITRTPPSSVDSALSSLPLTFPLLPSTVESVLKLSYSHPSSAIKFFRWSALYLPHSPLSWNLIVDILGRNALFEPMWDAIRSMKQSSALSLSTFASAFRSYCAANKIKEAIMTFDVMDRYGIPQDIAALNSLVSALCACGHVTEASTFFDKIKLRIAPDADTFAILLEGWEKEGNVKKAKTTFGEMVVRIGWRKESVPAYDAFLTMLVRAGLANEAINFLKVMQSKNCMPGIRFLSNTLDILVKDNAALDAISLWNIMVTDDGETGILPNLGMYNCIIMLLCSKQDFNSALRCLDAMPFHGAFPDDVTYNTIFECLVRIKKCREAEMFFQEMKKNERKVSPENCVAAIKMFFDEFDPQAAMDVWKYYVEENVKLDEDCVDELLVGLANLRRLSEVTKYAEDVIDKGGCVGWRTLEKLKVVFRAERKLDRYEYIEKKAERRRLER